MASAIIDAASPADEARRLLAGEEHQVTASVLMAMAEAARVLEPAPGSCAVVDGAAAPAPSIVRRDPAHQTQQAGPADDPFGEDLGEGGPD